MIRCLVTCLALAVTGLAVRYIVDDSARRDPECGQHVPSLMYRADTLAAIAMQCVGDAELKKAADFANSALVRQPLSQLALASLGSIADLANDYVHSDMWFERAARLSRRDFATETYWIDRTADQRQLAKEAQHLDALFRAGWESDVAEAQLRQLEGTAEGRSALFNVMKPSSPWAPGYLENVSELTDAELNARRMMLIEEAIGRRGKPPAFDASVCLPTIRALYSRNMLEAAHALHVAFNPSPTKSIVNDPSFTRLSSDLNSPFDWTRHNDGGLNITLEEGPFRSPHLQLSASDPGQFLIAEQTIRLDPGQYEARLAGAGTVQDDTSIVVKLSSVVQGEKLEPLRLPVPQDGKASTSEFSIAGSDHFFTLSLWLDAGESIESSSIELKSLMVVKKQ